MTAAAFDTSVVLAALLHEHPEHEAARSIIEFLATGLADVAMLCSAPATVATDLVRRGAEPAWAGERARDVLGMVRLLDLTDEDAVQALAHGDAEDAEALVAAAAFRRHGVACVVAGAERRKAFLDCGVDEVFSIADADRRIELLLPGGG